MACFALLPGDGTETAAQGGGPTDVRADGRVLLFYREGILSILGAKWLLARVFGGRKQAWFEHLQLILLCLHVHCEVNEPVQSNIARIQSFDRRCVIQRPGSIYIMLFLLICHLVATARASWLPPPPNTLECVVSFFYPNYSEFQNYFEIIILKSP